MVQGSLAMTAFFLSFTCSGPLLQRLLSHECGNGGNGGCVGVFVAFLCRVGRPWKIEGSMLIGAGLAPLKVHSRRMLERCAFTSCQHLCFLNSSSCRCCLRSTFFSYSSRQATLHECSYLPHRAPLALVESCQRHRHVSRPVGGDMWGFVLVGAKPENNIGEGLND